MPYCYVKRVLTINSRCIESFQEFLACVQTTITSFLFDYLGEILGEFKSIVVNYITILISTLLNPSSSAFYSVAIKLHYVAESPEEQNAKVP